MNEFLKNFRTSQNNRYAGKKNPYDGHYYSANKAKDLRSGNERRNARGNSHGSQGSSQKILQEIGELIPSIKSILETIIDNQEDVFEIRRRQEDSLQTIAIAFNEIAKTFCGNKMPERAETTTREMAPKAESSKDYSLDEIEKEGMQSAASKKREVIKLMKKLRKKGGTYKEISNFLNEKQIPTFSNNGKWHAQTIHRLCGKQ